VTETRHALEVEGGLRLAVRLVEPEAPRAGAPAILYLHGFGSRQDGEKARFFRERATADGFVFCSFDARGHGASDGSLGELSLSRGLEDVDSVRRWLAARGHERIALFGSSMGAATALWHAARRPEGVVAAAHIAPALGMLAGLERWAGPEGLERWRREGSIRFRNALVDTELAWSVIEDLRGYRFEDLCAAYRTPTVLFQGQLDASVDWREVERFARGAEDAEVELVLWEHGDHRLLDRLDEIWIRARARILAGRTKA